MRRPAIIWISLAALYGAFLFWYDGGGGPLGAEEIERYVAILERRAPGRSSLRTCARSSRAIPAATS